VKTVRFVQMTRLGSAALPLLFGTCAALASDWPMFRGSPALIGVTDGVLPPKPGLLWSAKTGGPVKSSPAIVGGTVFIGSHDSNVVALALADGKKLWSFQAGDPIESSPLVIEGKVFIGANDGVLYALDAQSGKLVWKYQTGEKILGGPNYFRDGNSLRIIVGSYDYKLHCVDAATGKSNWVYETGNYINGSPAIFDGKTVFGGCDAILHVITLKDGTKVSEIDGGAY